MAVFEEKEVNDTLNVLGVPVRLRYIPPPYFAVQDVIDVDEIVNESEPANIPFITAPFPDE